MPIDDDFDDERPEGSGPLPPEDRLWRHPSEIGSAATPPPAWFPPPTAAPAGRPSGARRVGTLAAACLLGAAVASTAFWVSRPTKVVVRQLATPRPAGQTPVTFTADRSATERLATTLADDLARVRVHKASGWLAGSALWLEPADTLVVAATLVADVDRILVTDARGIDRVARLAGTDPATGIAVLRLPAAAAAGSSELTATEVAPQNGEAAAVVGAADPGAGTDTGRATVSAVIVRAAGLRTLVSNLVLQDALQLDRPVAADAVGGALVDGAGRFLGLVVGNSADHLLGAVVPADTVLAVARDLLDDGEVRRARLGVQAADLDPAEAALLQVPGGAVITAVTPAGPASRAGLAVDDIIVAVAGQPVDDATDLVLILRDHDPGEVVAIRYRTADGAETTVRARLDD